MRFVAFELGHVYLNGIILVKQKEGKSARGGGDHVRGERNVLDLPVLLAIWFSVRQHQCNQVVVYSCRAPCESEGSIDVHRMKGNRQSRYMREVALVSELDCIRDGFVRRK